MSSYAITTTRSLAFLSAGIILLSYDIVSGFSPNSHITKSLSPKQSSFLGAVKLKEPPTTSSTATTQTNDVVVRFDPLNLSEESSDDDDDEIRSILKKDHRDVVGSLAAASTAVMIWVSNNEAANAAGGVSMPQSLIKSSGSFDPSSFNPVCGASDNFYRFLQSSAETVVGRENFSEYGPLIASGLLRIRLELCVVESFFNEAVGPFIKQNGLSWVLPLHETVETFLAGTVFALATTFILVGSTKLLTVIVTYADFFIGGPMRSFGGFFFDRARGKPVTFDIGLGPFQTRVIGPKDAPSAEENENDYSVDFTDKSASDIAVIVASGGVKLAGKGVKILREVLDAIDLFVGKSLVLWVTFYILVKFIHFKIFPNFPPF